MEYSQSTDTWAVFGDESFGDSISAVFDIDFDQDGFAWIGTSDGVFKFDGVEWISSLRILLNSYPSQSRNIHVDDLNRVWCSIRGHVYKLENGLWTSVSDSNTLFPNRIQSINSDQNGTIWIGTYHGLIKYDRIGFTQIEHEPDIPNMNIYDIEPIEPDNIWVGANGGLHQFIGSSWLSVDSVVFDNPLWGDQDWLVSAIDSHEETKLFGTWNMGLAINNGNEFHFLRGNEFGIDSNRFQINEVEFDLSQNIWMVTRPGNVIVYNADGLK